MVDKSLRKQRSAEINSWKGPRLAFDWGLGKGCATFDGKMSATFNSPMDILKSLTEPTLLVTEGSFMSYEQVRNDRTAFLEALYKAGHRIGTISSKQTDKCLIGKKSDEADARAIYELSLKSDTRGPQHLVVPIPREDNEEVERINKFDIRDNFFKREGVYWNDKKGLGKLRKFLPPEEDLDEDSKTSFCNKDGKYSSSLMRDLIEQIKSRNIKSRNEFERQVGFWASGYPCYMRAEIQRRNLKEINQQPDMLIDNDDEGDEEKKAKARRKLNWQNKEHLIMPWTRYRKALRKMVQCIINPKKMTECYPPKRTRFFNFDEEEEQVQVQ